MFSLPKPDDDAGLVFDLCISKVRSAATKADLESIRPIIVQAAADYDAAGIARQLHAVPETDLLGDVVSREEMVKVYENRMVGSSAPGRMVYHKLRGSSPNRRCPYCNQRSVNTLDHYLPKQKHSALTVTPINLVPSCTDCNKDKLAGGAGTAEETYLHPYFDDVSMFPWLQAEVIEGSPVAVRFYTVAPAGCDAVLAARIAFQFRTLRLAELYSSQAADEFSGRQKRLAKLLDIGGAPEVRAYIDEEYQSQVDNDANSWRSACYAAWLASDWFCEGGLREVG
ncbi:HNH endonuclease [Hyphobacterium sp.]|uniref:HNH endonuclease n=1 Tax=Hyphobacterium sp. TaxID=2004662 RepID=UPI003BA94D34